MVVTKDGEEAWQKLLERTPDLILTDAIMPVKDGFTTLEEIKSSEELKDIKVIVFSNLGQNEDMKRAKDLGAADYFVKANLSIGEVLDKVKINL